MKLTSDGITYSGKYLARGTFARVYDCGNGYILKCARVLKHTSNMHEVPAILTIRAHEDNRTLVHVPETRTISDCHSIKGADYTVYLQKRYKTFNASNANSVALEQYKALCELCRISWYACDIDASITQILPEWQWPVFQAELRQMALWACDLCTSAVWETPRRNVKADEHGNLILLDLFADMGS